MAEYVLEIDHDNDAECPNEWGGWKLTSFLLRKHRDSQPREQYLYEYVEHEDGTESEQLRADLQEKLKNGLAYLLDYYDHSNSCFLFHGQSTPDHWDTSSLAGVLEWQDEQSQPAPENRLASATGYLETYNQWASGEVYDFTLSRRYTDDPVASCCGFYNAEDLLNHLVDNCKLQPDDCVKVTGDCAFLVGKQDVASRFQLVQYFPTLELDVPECMTVIRQLLEWAANTGGWEAACWQQAQQLLQRWQQSHGNAEEAEDA